MDKVKLFRESTRELERNFEKLNSSDCCQCNVNTSQCFLVVEIGRNPGICVKELAELLKMDKSAVSRSVEELVQKGYVLRKPSTRDRRCVVLNLTDEGMARFSTIEKDMNMKFKRVFSMIPKEKQSQVLEALNIYNDAIKKSEVECCD
ncbi:MarR family winged helix-turn-helix transcriptional regulator [Butyrivibrio sp. XPD2006]|uniref:MarR family winged helix-turn-helix transcriptional regulator n=1 Tax=Butyrivibrio sp. XPD2006 TaxID=1280668 RepID=UPI0003B414FA|nr:MarR family transcriptional regulator [Butyrivibrio sp. XPD2006]